MSSVQIPSGFQGARSKKEEGKGPNAEVLPFNPSEPKPFSLSTSQNDSRTVEQESCPTCGRGGDGLEQLLANERIRRQDAEEDVAKKRREIARLKGELNSQRKQSPNAQAARELFDYWVARLGKRSNTVFGEKREKLLLARLNQFDRGQLERAIDGLARLPFVGAKGRQPQDGPGASRHDELAIVMADETTVERFIGYAEGPAPTPIRPVAVDGKDPWWRPLDRAVAALRREFGADAVNGSFGTGHRADEWWSVCPNHPELGDVLRIRERVGPGSSLELDCLRGCPQTVVLELVGELQAKQDERRAA